MTGKTDWTQQFTYPAPDEGKLAVSRIFHVVAQLRDILEADPPDGLEASEYLDDLFYAAKAIEAYISGLKAPRG